MGTFWGHVVLAAGIDPSDADAVVACVERALTPYDSPDPPDRYGDGGYWWWNLADEEWREGKRTEEFHERALPGLPVALCRLDDLVSADALHAFVDSYGEWHVSKATYVHPDPVWPEKFLALCARDRGHLAAFVRFKR